MALIEKGPFERFRDWLAQRLKPAPKPIATPFEHPPRDVIWREDGPEPGVWVELVRRSDGLYSFAEWKRQIVSAPKIEPWETEFPIFESGLYGSEGEARQAMVEHIDWLVGHRHHESDSRSGAMTIATHANQ
jgi:hypothetical protein